jgi:cbb3-type cytochrome oxidase cytochrome c subunit
MAASDKPYRNQYGLDVVFAVTSILMLASIVWMFWQDYDREFKTEGRSFRDVETAMAQRGALQLIPGKDEVSKAEAEVTAAKAKRDQQQEQINNALAELNRLRPAKEKAEAKFQSIKADLESINSFYNISIEKAGTRDDPEVKKHLERIVYLEKNAYEAGAERDNLMALMKKEQVRIDQIDAPLTRATSALKKINDRFDTQVKLAATKRWGYGDWFRTQPVVDAFASPVRIQQITNNEIPIDYNFTNVTRFDRCQSCHLGIDRPTYTKENLRALTQPETPAEKERLEAAREMLKKRREALAGLPEAKGVPEPSDLVFNTLPTDPRTDSRINEFCAHPRLDLYVGANSKHPVEKFGCSSCHAGQGSSTSFTLATHTPNNTAEKDRWIHQYDWQSLHDWDFPMLPQRFVESSCVKCHHEMTDLVGSDNRVEAPKLLRGFNLLKENGCFGCHEIQGTKAGNRIGPDVRLEPSPPLEDLSPLERSKIESDTENPPGRMRKVGPSLFRLSEKTNKEWTAKWIRAPREFRPDTKMPHFYGLSNNDVSVLPEAQKKFPAAEIWAITEYLFGASNEYLAMIGDEKGAQADKQREYELNVKQKETRLDRHEKLELNRLANRAALRTRAQKDVKQVDRAAGYQGDTAKGRILFTERGCLACHVHEGTTKAQGTAGKADFAAAVQGEAVFGPNLSQVAAKLGSDKQAARTWLVQWIMNPHVHSPRSRMPITHLSAHEAADVAAWLLSQPATDLGPDWDTLKVEQPALAELKELARVYLVRIMAKEDIETLLKGQKVDDLILADLPVDEQELADNFSETGLKHYLGRKAIFRLGCFGCHDVPGYDSAKSIGVGLNDWGKKAPERLAFEDIENFLIKNFHVVDSLVDKDGKPVPFEKDPHTGVVKKPYERFYAEKLEHHHMDRIGYLNQKLLDPRSYDYERLRAWDDRSRMPQFRFARVRKKTDENDDQYAARAWVDEAAAREAVMTFILGLVAEQVPTRVISQPKGDRLAEVKGRQILDKYNCAGCHMVRPGAYDFRVTPESLQALEKAHSDAQAQVKSGGYTFLDHNHWVGTNIPTGDRLMAHAPRAVLIDPGEDEENPGSKKERRLVMFRLAEALRYVAPDGKVKDIPSSNFVFVPLGDVVPNPQVIASQADLERSVSDRAAFGGALSNLLVPYLMKKDPVIFKLEGTEQTGDSGNARAALPPPLLSEGERTQPDWLYNFLLDPQQVRRMTILRMPKFNMSRDEARALVAYFAAVDRINNPAVGLQYPLDSVPQQGDLDNPYWTAMNKEYLQRLQEAPKGDKGALSARLAAYKKGWETLQQESTPAVKKALDQAKEEVASQTKEKEAKQKLHDKEKDAAKKEEHKKDLEAIVGILGAAESQVAGLTAQLAKLSVEAQEKGWKESEAYAADAWRLVLNRKLCLQCHEIGGLRAGNLQTQGPPLALASQRLRPDWTYRWIASPSHFAPYAGSPMPPYFPANSLGKEYHHLFKGTGPEQVRAARDVLMNYPRVSALPINRLYRPEMGEEKK